MSKHRNSVAVGLVIPKHWMDSSRQWNMREKCRDEEHIKITIWRKRFFWVQWPCLNFILQDNNKNNLTKIKAYPFDNRQGKPYIFCMLQPLHYFITTINIAYLVRTEEAWICQTSNLHNVCKPFKNKGILLPNTSQEQPYRVTYIPDVWYLLENSNQMQAASSVNTDISLEILVLRTLQKGLNNNNTIDLHILPDYKA